jgi:CPA1 family monovalent cation:H+ antiporter
MQNFEFIVILFSVTIALLAVGDKWKIPNPVLLVLAGLALGFLPNVPDLSINPEIIFLIFLPPVLYDAAANTSWHDFKSEIRPISTLAFVLVVFTMVGVAVAAHFVIPNFSWPMAFVLGAIVSPPDAVAATNITKGLVISKRVVTILEGESLINDAFALIAYRFAVAAVATGTFLFWQAGLDFFQVVVGGVAVGLACGYALTLIHARIVSNSIISTSLSLLTPFLTYQLAERTHTSGVLAVVCSGLIISWRSSEVFSHQTRIRSKSVWITLITLLNSFVFILIGLQLSAIVNDLGHYEYQQLILYGLVISLTTIFIRIVSVFGMSYRGLVKESQEPGKRNIHDTWQNVSIIAWTGTRGVVSLASALALPALLVNGSVFPQRSLILFLSFAVIFITLVLQGVSLPWLIKILKVEQGEESIREEIELRLFLAGRVTDFIKYRLVGRFDEQAILLVRKHYEDVMDSLLKQWDGDGWKGRLTERIDELGAAGSGLALQLQINRFQREILIQFHKEGSYQQSVIRLLEEELDLEELKIGRTKE